MIPSASGTDVMKIADAAEEGRDDVAELPPTIDRASLVLGWASVYSSFLLHAERAARRHGLNPAEILLQVGRRKAVGGQENIIGEIALDMAVDAERV